jgi:two-component system, NtrC family, sensor histidine kinase HydH
MRTERTLMNERLRFVLFPVVGAMVFICLSFVHDGLRTDRDLQTYYLPIGVGITVGLTVAFLQNRMETRTRKYERQLSREREDAALGRVAAAIAHEVRNPLNALGMGLQRLQMEAGELSIDHQQLVSLMLDSVTRTNRTIGGLLKYARPQKPNPQSMRLDLMIDEVLLLYQSRCKEMGIRITQNIGFRGPVMGDADLLNQVVQNLLVNAIEAQSGGGFIHIELKRRGSEVSLAIRNGGFFVPADHAQCIFEPYFTTKTDGTGLGLPIAQRLMEAHGGRLEIRSLANNQVEMVAHLPLV